MTQALRATAAGMIVAGVWGCGPAPALAAETAIRTMRVLVLNPAGAPLEVLTGAEAAAARVFRHAGIDTTWRQASEARGAPALVAAEDLATVIIVNLMSEAMEARVRLPPTAVGFGVAGGRFANIMFGRVERLAHGTSTDLATVLGHAIAHEIGHLLLPPNAHSSGGIMNATLDPLLAAQGVLWFSSREADRVRAGIATLARTHDAMASARLIRDHIE